jgi:hypothetical protein
MPRSKTTRFGDGHGGQGENPRLEPRMSVHDDGSKWDGCNMAGGEGGTMEGDVVIVEDGDWMPLIAFSSTGSLFYLVLVLLRIVFGRETIIL